MNYYESVVIIEPSLNEEQVEEVVEKIKNKIIEAGGEIIKEDRWGLRKLAYGLKKRKDGYYVIFTIKVSAEFIKELEDFYKLYEPIFKFMTIKLKKKELEVLIKELQSLEVSK